MISHHIFVYVLLCVRKNRSARVRPRGVNAQFEKTRIQLYDGLVRCQWHYYCHFMCCFRLHLILKVFIRCHLSINLWILSWMSSAGILRVSFLHWRIAFWGAHLTAFGNRRFKLSCYSRVGSTSWGVYVRASEVSDLHLMGFRNHSHSSPIHSLLNPPTSSNKRTLQHLPKKDFLHMREKIIRWSWWILILEKQGLMKISVGWISRWCSKCASGSCSTTHLASSRLMYEISTLQF